MKWDESGTAYIVCVTLAKYVCNIECAMFWNGAERVPKQNWNSIVVTSKSVYFVYFSIRLNFKGSAYVRERKPFG